MTAPDLSKLIRFNDMHGDIWGGVLIRDNLPIIYDPTPWGQKGASPGSVRLFVLPRRGMIYWSIWLNYRQVSQALRNCHVDEVRHFVDLYLARRKKREEGAVVYLQELHPEDASKEEILQAMRGILSEMLFLVDENGVELLRDFADMLDELRDTTREWISCAETVGMTED